MRKTAFILSIVCVAFVVLATCLKLAGIPGSHVLYLLFSGLFAGVVLPMHFFAISREEKGSMRRAANVLATLIGMHVVIGLLFLVLQWNGYVLFFFQGGILALIFIPVAFIAAQRGERIRPRFIVLMFALIAVALLIAWQAAEEPLTPKEDVGARQTFETELAQYAREKATTDSMISVYEHSGDSVDPSAKYLFEDALALIQLIENYKCSYLEVLNNGEGCTEEDHRYHITNYDDVMVSTERFVGKDVMHPNGLGKSLYIELRTFQKTSLHMDLKLDIPVHDDLVYTEQWVKDNFYHATPYETMTRLTQIQTKVYLSVKESIERNLFRPTTRVVL